jgi:probable HAF family extracellular repeat protein
MRRYTFAVAAVLLVLFPWRQATFADAPRYSITNLGTLGDLVPTITGVNASGQVSGYVSGPAGLRAVRYTNGAWQYLPGLDTTFSVANGINAAGDLVGYYANAEGAVRAYRYHAGLVETIEPLAGGSMTLGYAINKQGDVVGYGDSPSGIVAFIARRGESAEALPTLGGAVTLACGINDAGQVAGWSLTSDGAQHAIRIDVGQTSPVDIGAFTSAAASAGCAIDSDGRVGGQIQKANSAVHAFRYHDGAVQDLDTFNSLASNVESMANGVSVGYYADAAGGLRAFVSSDDAGSADLNTLADDAAGWVLSIAKGVNANGVIVGEGTFNGQPAVFRLTPPAKDTTPPAIENLAATPSSIWPPKGQMVSVSVTFTAADDSGEAPACALTGIAGPGTSPNDYALTGPQTAMVRAVGGSTYTLTETCVDAAGNGAATSVDVVVPRDATAPTITSIWATPSHIWPPNNKMAPVSVHVTATDDVDNAPSCSVTSISGAPSSDYEITGAFTANVRASKNSDGSNRIYSLKVTCTDAAGNRSTAIARVSICKDPAESAFASSTLKSDAKSNKK